MNEPILGKSQPHVYDYKTISWGAFLKLKEASQKVADDMGYPVYLVGSATYKELPRDIDISIIIPIKDYIKKFKISPDEDSKFYLAYAIQKTCNDFTSVIDLQFCIDYHLDIKVCPDTWWKEKPKMLIAKPQNRKD